MAKTRRSARGGKKRDNEAAKDYIANALDNPASNELDAKYDQATEDVSRRLEDTRGKIYELDEKTKEGLDTQLAAQKALQERGFADQRSNLLTRLFGQGRTEGQLAGEMGGQLIGDQQLTLQQVDAADAANRSNMRMGITQLGQQNLGMQGDFAAKARAAELQRMGIASTERSNSLQAATGLRSSYISAGAQKAAARMQANASMYGSDQSLAAAGLSADARVASARIGAAAQNYSSDQQLLASKASAGAHRAAALASMRGTMYASDNQLKASRFSTSSNNAQFHHDLGFRNQQLVQQGQLTREGFANDQKLAQMGIDASKPSTTDKILGVAGTALSIFSDRELKEDIKVIDNAVDKLAQLRGVDFEWKHRPGKRSGGIIAQEVEDILPDAVDHTPAGRIVDYGYVIGLIVAAVNELSKKAG